MKLLSLVIIFSLLSGCSSPEAEKERVVVAVGGKTAILYLPLTLAEQNGFFKTEGLSLEIHDFPGGAKALQAMVSGSADVVMGAYDHTIQMQAQKKSLTAIVLVTRYPGLALGVRSDLAERIKQISDLKGMKVGISAPGSSTHFFLNFLLSKQGLKPDDVSAIGVGSSVSAVAAVEQKQVDALVNPDPMITMLDGRGLIKVLADSRTEKESRETVGGEYPFATLYTTQEFIARHPATAQRLVNAIVKALRWMQGKSAEEIAQALPEEYFAGNKELYLKGLTNSRETFSPDGRFHEAAAQNALAVLKLFDEKVAQANIDLSTTYTNRFVEQALK